MSELSYKVLTRNVCKNVTKTRIRVTVVGEEKQLSITYTEGMIGFSHPAPKAHAPYYIVICGLSGPTIFLHIIS